MIDGRDKVGRLWDRSRRLGQDGQDIPLIKDVRLSRCPSMAEMLDRMTWVGRAIFAAIAAVLPK